MQPLSLREDSTASTSTCLFWSFADSNTRTATTDGTLVFRNSTTACYSIEENTHCLYCFTEFFNEWQLQAHLATQQHPPLNEMRTTRFKFLPKNSCKVCHGEVKLNADSNHSCSEKIGQTLQNNEKHMFKHGTPLTCILCTGTQLYSFYHLIIHIIVRHGFEGKLESRGKNPCPLCYSLFNTDKANVIEYHAVKEHMPEIYMEYLKDMQPDCSSCVSMRSTFSCRIPIKLCKADKTVVMDKKNCSEHFKHLPCMVAHLQSAHAPIPTKFLNQSLRPHTCRHCLHTFAFSSQLRQHVTRKHEFLARQRVHYVESQGKLRKSLSDNTCFFCWHNFHSIFQLQSHIQARHLDSWRRCGLCGREHCKFNETRASKLVYMEIMAHDRLHSRQLEEHVQEMHRIVIGSMDPHPTTPVQVNTEKYFGRINLDFASEKRKKIIRDYTDDFEKIGAVNREIQQDILLMGDM